MKIALTIAGSDASGGAGIQADIKTFCAHGVYATSAITAVTVQNTRKVYDIQEIRQDIVAGQIQCLFDDMEIHAVKIGMVSSIGLIETIAATLSANSLPPVVLDPVMISKSGYALLMEDAQKALIQHLFPLAHVVTPNIFEARVLIQKDIRTIPDMKDAAKHIHGLGVKNVVVKGGHLDSEKAVDIVYDGSTFLELSSERFHTPHTHGTGCTFSSAIAANLALEKPFLEAVTLAKEYITGAIEHGLPIGHGHGPTHHFYRFYPK